MPDHEENPAIEKSSSRDIATSAHYRMDAHEGLCTERHRTLNGLLLAAGEDRKEIKVAIARIEARMWSTITAASFAMLSVIITLIGGILVYLSK